MVGSAGQELCHAAQAQRHPLLPGSTEARRCEARAARASWHARAVPRWTHLVIQQHRPVAVRRHKRRALAAGQPGQRHAARGVGAAVHVEAERGRGAGVAGRGLELRTQAQQHHCGNEGGKASSRVNKWDGEERRLAAGRQARWQARQSTGPGACHRPTFRLASAEQARPTPQLPVRHRGQVHAGRAARAGGAHLPPWRAPPPGQNRQRSWA